MFKGSNIEVDIWMLVVEENKEFTEFGSLENKIWKRNDVFLLSRI